MPGNYWKSSQEPRPSAERGDTVVVRTSRHPHSRARRSVVGFAKGFRLIVIASMVLPHLHADDATTAPVTHITDAQDRLGTGKLKPSAEKRARASVLYAQALLLPDDDSGDRSTAIDLLRQVVELDPTFIAASVKLANLLLQDGQLDEALAKLEKAAGSHPDSVSVNVALAYTQKLRGQTEQALRYSRRALLADPNQALAMRVMLEISASQNDLAGGVIHVEDILKAGGVDVPPTAWLNLARLYLEVARTDGHAVANDVLLRTRLPILQQAASKSPLSADTFSLLADTYRELGRKAEALKALDRAHEIDPDDVEILLHRGDLETDLGRKVDAVKDYENAYAANPSLPGLHDLLGGLYLDLGIANEQAGHPDKAQEYFQHVFSSSNCPPDAYLKLAFYQLEHKEIKEAGQTLATAEVHFPQSARIRFYEAVQHRYEKNYAAALDSLNQARTLATGPEATVLNPAFYIETAETLDLAGKSTEMESNLREGLNRFPDNPELMNELAYYYAEHASHLDEALALSKRAASLEPDNGPIMDTWGWVYFQMGQPKDALPYLQRAAFMTNNDPVVLQHVGDAYLKLGLRREAIATWTRALEKDPRNGDLANRIDAAQAQAKNAHLRSAPTP